MMTNNDLRELVNNVSIKYFNKPLAKNVIVKVNNRLSRACGQEYRDYRTFNLHIDIGGKFLRSKFPKVIIIDCIKHELCHLYLEPKHLRRAHGRVFKHLLKKVHGIYYIPGILNNYNPKKIIYVYQCKQCHHLSYYGTPNADKRWICRCHGQLKPIGFVHENVLLKAFLHQQYTKPCTKMPQNTNLVKTHNVQLSLF